MAMSFYPNIASYFMNLTISSILQALHEQDEK